MTGVARGKIMPAEKFAEDDGMRLPESVFLQTVTGDYPPETGEAMSPAEIDIILQGPTPDGARRALGGRPDRAGDPRLPYSDGRRVSMAPRHVLRRVLELYGAARLEPVVAPGTRVLPGRAEWTPTIR